MTACLITGPFRSGTSLVAQLVHRLGWQVAALIPAPFPPTWRGDFEDTLLTVRLIRREAVDWRAYLAERVRVSSLLGFGGRIALKSPYLAPYWKEILEAIGEPAPVVIRTFRNEPERQASLQAHPMLSVADDELIRRALVDIAPTIELGYEWMVEDPRRAAEALAAALGVRDDADVAAAAALVGAPTQYAPPDPLSGG